MKKSKQQKVKVVMHQHQDEFGRVFGAPHPIDAEHTKSSTRKFHDLTIKRS
jgi:hypothetical protein